MRHLITLLLCLFCTNAAAQQPQEYAYGPDPDQRLDLYRPAEARNAPIIVMLHGGAWRIGDKGNRAVWQAKAAHWLPQGYIFASINTRLLPAADPVEQTRDLARAMGFVRQNAHHWDGDPDNIILMGHSAGAHVAALLATRDDLRQAAGLRRWNGTILLDSAVLDLPAIMRDNPARLYRRAFGRDPRFWTAASPAAHLSGGEGPFLIVCSTLRDTPCPQARAFGALAADAGIAVTVLPVALSHGDINAHLGRPNGYTRAVDNWISGLN